MNMVKIIKNTTQHFIHHQGVQFASSLSYTSLLSVVPITMLLFFISLQTDYFSHVYIAIEHQFLESFLPAKREEIEIYLLQLAENSSSFSYLGYIILLVSAIWLSLGIERTINHLWHVKTPRRLLLRVPAHIVLWVLGPILIMLSISLSTWITSQHYLSGFTKEISFALKLLPLFISSTALFLLYFFVPNTQVRFKYALSSGFAAGLLFELSKWLFTIYITQYALYEKLYGALATLPIFMLWIFITWIVVLWGVSLSVTLQKQGQST